MAIVGTEDPALLGQFQPQNAEVDGNDGYQDYFGFDEIKKHFLPDGKQWIAFKPMNEGARAKYEAKTSRDIKFNRRTDDAAIRVNTADDRHEVILASVCDWHMVRRTVNGWEPVAFDAGGKVTPGGTFAQWMAKADPKLINDLHQAIVRANPWMTSEMTVEMVDEELARLTQLRSELVEREAAEKNS